MEATILQGETVLGSGTIKHLDPPMGVAFGSFEPSGRYSAYLHANTIDGEYFGDKGADFTATVDGREVDAASISLEDWSRTLGEFRFNIWFREEKEYAPLFRNHPEFRVHQSDAS